MAKTPRKQITVSQALRQAIARSEMTPYQLAKESGIGTDSVYRFLEREDYQLRIDAVDKLAHTLGLALQAVPRTD